MNKSLTIFLSLVCVVVLTVSVFASQKGSYGNTNYKLMKKGSAQSSHAHHHGDMAMADIHGTQPGSKIRGMVKFTQIKDGVKVYAHVHGVSTSGLHGFHIHEKGSCQEAGKAAGGHYNPEGVEHGFLPDDGMGGAHAGDMGNIMIDSKGSGELELILPGLSIAGDKNVSGRAVILHEKEDDFGQPTGHAGARIGCGVIQNMKDMPKGSY